VTLPSTLVQHSSLAGGAIAGTFSAYFIPERALCCGSAPVHDGISLHPPPLYCWSRIDEKKQGNVSRIEKQDTGGGNSQVPAGSGGRCSSVGAGCLQQ
jgi:hypothetical protein